MDSRHSHEEGLIPVEQFVKFFKMLLVYFTFLEMLQLGFRDEESA
jgi:hypothetical protein